MKRIVTIQDVSCVGKCSLTVALPIISAMGVEAAVIPTAVLSTHTAFSGFTFHDLTDEIEPITEHWKKENIKFSAVYTGYLGSKRQLDICSRIFDDMKADGSLIFADPAMADNGNLYKGFTKEFAKEMADLCGKADIVVPNLTEASFMLDVPYVGDNYDKDYIKDILVRLTEKGTKVACLTGVSFEEGKLGAMAYDSESGKFYEYYREKFPFSFHGTGDIFASAMLGALALEKGLEESMKIAVDYTVECIKITCEHPDHNWYGVEFESAIPYLVDRIK